MLNIKISYLIVVFSLVFWSTFAYFTMYEQISNQQQYAKLINISGKQRMLSQKTTLIAKRIFETNNKQLTQHFNELVTIMKSDHQFILSNLTTQHMKQIYFNQPYFLDNNVQNYFTLLDKFLNNKNLQTLQELENYSFILLDNLNYAVNEFEIESDFNTNELMKRELFIFLGTLLTILLEAILIIIPTVRKVEESKKQMKQFNTLLTLKVEEQKTIILQDEIERQEKEKIIQEKERHASMGEMIGNIAHQWRQPLSVISTGASGMKVQKQHDVLSDDEFYKVCDSINDNAQYLSKTINNFDNLIHKHKTKTKYTLNKEIKNILKLMNPTFKQNNINVSLHIDEPIEIYGYENELTQALINLLNNSQEALSKNKIEFKYIDISIKKINNEIKIIIKDNAGGIRDDILSKIFDPYFTTKHKSQGTGLGLHMVYIFIVQTMNGNIKATNVKHLYNKTYYRCAQFTITLPLS